MISTTAECSESTGVDGCRTTLDVVHVRALVGDDQRPLELAHVLGVDPEVGLQRDLDVDARRDVDERAARPDRGVQRGELVVADRDHGAEVLAEQVLVLAQRGVGVDEDHALLLELLVDLVVDHLGLVLRRHSGDQALLLRLGDAQLVVGVLDVGRQVVPGRSLLLRRADEVLDLVEVDAGQVGTPRRHRLLVEQPQALEPQLEHPLGLVLQRRDVLDHLAGQAAASGRAGRVGVGPAEVVATQPLELGVSVGLCGGHAGSLPVTGVVGVVEPCSGTCVVQTPSPWARVAKRWTWVPSSRLKAAVSASQSAGNSWAT